MQSINNDYTDTIYQGCLNSEIFKSDLIVLLNKMKYKCCLESAL